MDAGVHVVISAAILMMTWLEAVSSKLPRV